MVELSTLLTGPLPLHERLTGLCAASAAAMRCDQVAILHIDGNEYRGIAAHGLPANLADGFTDFTVPRTRQIVTEFEACDDYLLVNNAASHPTLHEAARAAGIESVVFVPFRKPDGSPLGFLTASYVAAKRTISTEEAGLAVGFTVMTRTTLLRNIETQRHQEVAKAMLLVEESERRRLGRDIHDDPLQRILGLRIGLEGFRQKLTDPVLQEAMAAFIEQCRQASTSLREVMLQTHPSGSELVELRDVLRSMVDRSDYGPLVELEFADGRTVQSPSYLVPSLNRVAEQAARNTLQHARATKLCVQLDDQNDGTRLIVVDDGVGFDPSATPDNRLGLVSMRERAELLGGTFSINSAPNRGTTVTAWFPHAPRH